MDALAGLLDGPRARQAFLLRSCLESPWSLRIEDEAPLTVMAVARGHAYVLLGDEEHRLETGDVAVFRGPDHYTVADSPQTNPQVAIGPGQVCTPLDTSTGKALVESFGCGVRTWGDPQTGPTILLTGTYEHAGAVSARLLQALPPLVVVRATDWNSPIVPLLNAEIVKDDPGQEAVLDRLLDLLLIKVLRAYFSRDDAPGWYRATTDPIIGRALKLIHHNPAHAWTVAELASETGLSRAALARRFTELVGEPPMSYLTGWRIAIAADLLLEPDTTLASVADTVGYGTPFALSTAFKRVKGISPREHVRLARAEEKAAA